MILPSMTYQEIANTIKRDWEQDLYRGYNSCFGMREKYGIYVQKHVKANEFHFFGARQKTTKDKNNYIFLFYTHGKEQYNRVGILRNFWLEYERRDGVHAVHFNHLSLDEYTFYVPHFFERYKERFLDIKFPDHDCDKLQDIIQVYFMSNELVKAQPQDNPKYPGGIFASVMDGICLGVDLGNGIWEFRTFVSFELLKGNQVAISKEDRVDMEQAYSLCQRGLINI